MTDRSVRVRLSLTHSDFSRGLATAAAETSAFAKTLDTSNNKMSMLLQTGIALGPSLVPVMGAVAAGGIGVAEALGATAVGAGVAVLAFQGVGDALKALNDFAVDPTSEHLQTLHEKMAVLGPDGQRFVLMLQDLRPELQQLQALAQEGLLPGVTEGLDHLLDIQPQVQSLVTNIATALGQVAAEGGEALASPFWTDFLDFIATDGRDSMVTMLQIIGQLTKASASLIMAFDPLSQDIGTALLDRTTELAHWADTLDQSQGFQGFVDFMERVGPEVWDTLGSIGEALVELTKAAAPVGEVSLPIIQAIAETLSAIASSPVGPVLIAAAAGINAISRAVALYNATSGSALGTLLFGGKGSDGKTKVGLLSRTGVTAQTAGIRAAASAVGLLALSFTDLDESMGLSNTATFALLGSIAGPWGAVVGGMIGQLKDAAGANDALEAAMRRVDDVASSSPLDLQARDAALESLRQQTADLDQELSTLSFGDVFKPARNIGMIFGSDSGVSDAQEQANAFEIQTQAIRTNLLEFAGDVDGTGVQITDNVEEMADRVIPALEAVGYSTEDITTLLTTGKGWDVAKRAVTDYVASQDSAKGRTDNLIGAVRDLDNQLISTTSSAEALSNALDELLNPQMNLEAATDAYTSALRHWEDELDKANKTLKGNSDAAITNRASLRGRVDLLKQQLAAEANAGWGTERLTNSMQRERRALLDAGEAAGLQRKEMQDLLKTYGLTPRLIETLIRANTESAMQNISKLKAYLASLHDKTINITTIQNTATSQQSAHDFRQGGGAYGGQVFGPGGPRDDMVPRMLSNREWVQPVDAVDYYGPGFMAAVQHKTFPRMADGGSVAWFADGMPRGSRAPMSYGFRTSVPGDAARGSLRISGELTFGEDGRAYIRGVAREALDGDADFAASAARQRGGR